MASVKQRPDGKYRARYRDSDGKEHAQHFDRKRDADRWLDKMSSDLLRGVWVDPDAGKVTFGAWWGDYDKTKTKRRATTKARDLAVIRRWWLPAFKDVQLKAITPGRVRAVVADMTEALAPATVRTNYGVFRAVMAAAVDADLIGRSPCRGVEMPDPSAAPPRFLSVVELAALADAMPVEYRPMVYVAGVVGLRWSEVAGLRVGRLDFLRRTLTVAETVAEVEGKIMFAPPKTLASCRTVGVPAPVMDMLAEHLARRGRPGPDELVFVAERGGPLRAPHFRRRVWAPAVKAAKLEGLTFHGLRHSAAGLMIELGAHPRVIQQRLGHSSIRTTMDVYGSVLPTVDDAVTAGLAELVTESRGLTADQAESGTSAG